MYFYIYDIFLNNKKFNNILSKIETRLSDLDIKGKICRLNLLKNLKELLEDAKKNGIKTVVAVGDDSTFNKIINVAINLDLTVGYIPLIKTSKIAEILGILPFEGACDILAQRIIKKLDIGKINNYYFIDSAKIINENVIIKLNNFSITPLNNNHIYFCNLGVELLNYQYRCHPADGLLELIIIPEQKKLLFRTKKTAKQSMFPFTKIKVNAVNDQATITIDNKLVVKTPADIEIVPEKLKIIVGTNRHFT